MQINSALHLLFFVAVLAFLLLQLLFRKELGLWFLALISGTPAPLGSIFRMRLRGKNPEPIVHSAVKSKKANLKVSLRQIEQHADAGGDVERVVLAMIMAKGAGIPLTFAEAIRMDLDGSDPVAWVRAQVPPPEERVVPSGVRWLLKRQIARSAPRRSIAATVLAPVWFIVGLLTFPFVISAARRRAARASLPLEPGEVVSARLRGLDPRSIVDAAIRLRDAGVDGVEFETLHTVAFIGGNLDRIVETVLAARSRGFELEFDDATALSLGGVDPMRLVEAVSAARAGGWTLAGKEAAEIVYAGHDPVEFVQRELSRVPVG